VQQLTEPLRSDQLFPGVLLRIRLSTAEHYQSVAVLRA
jgi:hypothetical protein